mmetsp:Transcript_8778/g.19314  ORF Transcript_8778/g.19314 Transcript_8778/m.19314 type:complete len:732 (-) Transcript_8778:592-2787(-)
MNQLATHASASVASGGPPTVPHTTSRSTPSRLKRPTPGNVEAPSTHLLPPYLLLSLFSALFVLLYATGSFTAYISLMEVESEGSYRGQTMGDDDVTLYQYLFHHSNGISFKTDGTDDGGGVKYLDERKHPRDNRPFFPRCADEPFLKISHPGNAELGLMEVPRLWVPPGPKHESGDSEIWHKRTGKLMTPDEAAEIGTYSPWGDETIFVAISSYRDWQCRYTVESIFGRASHPERIRVAVVEQIIDGDDKCDVPLSPCESDPNQALCKYADRIDVYTMDAEKAVGPTFARHLGHRMYRGEYFAMQVDAHVSFITDWDVDIIAQFESAENEMAVLTTYLSDVTGSIDPETGKGLRKGRPIMCDSYFEPSVQGLHMRHGQQPEAAPTIHGEPQLEPFWAAGFSFSRGHFVVNVPYDQYLPMIFQGEEISMGMRAFTYGYDFYAPEHSVCFHMYSVGQHQKLRKKVKTFWEHANSFNGVGKVSMRRLNAIIKLLQIDDPNPNEYNKIDEFKYGLGTVRRVEQMYDLLGIHFLEIPQSVEGHLCSFVQGGVMHNFLVPNLRKDGMGIDWTGIKYEFEDPKADKETKEAKKVQKAKAKNLQAKEQLQESIIREIADRLKVMGDPDKTVAELESVVKRVRNGESLVKIQKEYAEKFANPMKQVSRSKIQFTVANLEGVLGKTGTFVVETRPDWAPIGVQRFHVSAVNLQLMERILLNNHEIFWYFCYDPYISLSSRN